LLLDKQVPILPQYRL